MRYQLVIDFSPVYELINSLYKFIHHKQVKNLYLQDDWFQETQQKLDPQFARQLADERYEVLHRINLLVWQYKGDQTADAFLTWLQNQPAGDIYELLSPWVDSIPGNLGEIRDRMVYLLAKWNEQYFQKMDSNILHSLENDAEEKERLLTTLSPIDLIEEATNGLRLEETEKVKTVILTPQYHYYPATILDFHENICTCLYPSMRAMKVANGEVGGKMYSLVAITQALADSNRLKILRVLNQYPANFAEIHKLLGLAKSTTNYHISTLRRAGLIRAHHFGRSTAQKYSLRTSKIEKLGEQIMAFIKGEK
ncbi:ArsR/SmtB family transcription factor [Siminovitchia terrae]|uniref:ArsR family transcriptional regulator n=1 Tax=Siminovitchia terrae TaxID=1914933 RepID=A0A429X7Q9_SIMTE|nr:winged helix-turn-helix domain-containing protein [Siminovitchia terrae]RST59434.1 ArsR family transcriptional regulator [Siminovitchia terrae]GIN92938.1 hypothetical protein J22TS1_39890 [Siminovitchia terrae]